MDEHVENVNGMVRQSLIIPHYVQLDCKSLGFSPCARLLRTRFIEDAMCRYEHPSLPVGIRFPIHLRRSPMPNLLNSYIHNAPVV